MDSKQKRCPNGSRQNKKGICKAKKKGKKSKQEGAAPKADKICKINVTTNRCSLQGTVRPEDCTYNSTSKRCIQIKKKKKKKERKKEKKKKEKEKKKEQVEVLDNKIRFQQLCLENKTLNKIERIDCLRMKEEIERENLQENDTNMLYPNLHDPNFNMKITHKKEFFDTRYNDEIMDVKEASNKLCQFKEFELSPHQRFVRNFLSFQTPYNSLLLFHGLGTGKTCSAILVCEEMRHFNKQMGINKRIMIVASPNVQANFKLQLFDKRKLKNIEGNWTMQSCTSNSFINEVNPMNMPGFTKDKIIRQVNRIINTSYHFMGYSKFSNYIKKKINNIDRKKANWKKKEVKILKKYFSGRLIVIDEVHNIRATEEKKTKAIIENLQKVVYNADNLKLLMLSATPMFNTYKEIIWLLNLMNLNDKRFPIKTKEVFTSSGNWTTNAAGKEVGKELLIQKATGYVSFVSGDNPYTFPYRILPRQFLSPEYLLNTGEGDTYPQKTVDGRNILEGIKRLDLVMNMIGDYQEKAYYYIINKMKDKFPAFENVEKGLGYQILEPPLQVLNMAYPSVDFDESGDDANVILYGKEGLNRVMDMVGTKKQYKYNAQALKKYGRIFTEENIGNYSGKINFICKQIRKSKGIILIYSQYIDGGCVPIALALEEMGFRRYGAVPSLFHTKPIPTNPLSFDFIPSYTMITGDSSLSPNNAVAINMATNEDNKNGEKIKVIIISRAASEGIDLKNIRQIHILDPWYNLNRTNQIEGRGIRHCSHKDLSFQERNTEIYMYGTRLTESNQEAVDLYIYRLAEKKAILIGKVTRVLKENAVDCILNAGQTGLTVKKMSQTITQKISSGKTIKYPVGSQPYTSLCDYMKKCAFTCQSTKVIDEINMDTYGEDYIIMNLDMIIQIIRNLFKDKYYYKKNDLISRINFKKTYPKIQINMALNQLISDKNLYITDMLNRIGYLINIGDYYMFQPVEIDNEHIMRFNRVHPIDYKQNQLSIHLLKKTKKSESNKKYQKKKAIAVVEQLKLVESQLTKKTPILAGLKATWYQLCYRILNSKDSKKYRIESTFRSRIPKYTVHHLIDSMEYDNQLSLLNMLYTKESLEANTQGSYAKDYFDSFKIQGNKLEGLLLNKEHEIIIHILDDGKWRKVKHTEFEKFTNALKEKKEEIHQNINNIIGFISYEKKRNCFMNNCFKTLIISNRKDRGALCDNKSKKDVIYLLNNVVQKSKSIGIQNYKATDKQNINGDNMKINQPQLCCELELIMRYYTEERLNGKIWFLSLVDAMISNIIK